MLDSSGRGRGGVGPDCDFIPFSWYCIGSRTQHLLRPRAIILPPPQKGSNLAAGRVFCAWTAEAHGRAHGRDCACRTRSSPARVPDAAARAPATRAASGKRVRAQAFAGPCFIPIQYCRWGVAVTPPRDSSSRFLSLR